MTYRITEKDLQVVCNRLNAVLDRPMQPWDKSGDRYRANIGNFHISHAYGGVSLHEMMTDGGGVRDTFSCGHMPKRELYHRMHAMLDGIDIAQSA